jgi:hypothetical protein
MYLKFFAWLFNWSLVTLYWSISQESICTKIVRKDLKEQTLFCHVYWGTKTGGVLLLKDGTIKMQDGIADSIYINRWSWVRHGKVDFGTSKKIKKKKKIKLNNRYDILKTENKKR